MRSKWRRVFLFQALRRSTERQRGFLSKCCGAVPKEENVSAYGTDSPLCEGGQGDCALNRMTLAL